MKKKAPLYQHRPTVSALAAMISLALVPSTTSADEYSPASLTHSASDFGTIGLMQMPSARMRDEGALSLGVTNNDDYIHYNVSLQLFPWLETNIRYTQVHDVLYSNAESFSGDTDYTDKSLDVKLRLLQESYYLPEVSLGLQDLGGTGLFDSEFFAASKRVGPFDFTLGVAWGYLGNRGNLLGDKADSTDCGRGSDNQWGTFSVSRMFTGCATVYGGVEYQTPYAPLRLKLEYDGNDYKSDFPVTQGKASMPVSTPWNVGMVYAISDWADFRLSYERGNTVTAGLTMSTNVAQLKQVWLDEAKPEYKPKADTDDLTPEEWQTLTNQIKSVAGYEQVHLYKDGDTITVQGNQTKYRNTREAEERASLLIANTGVKANTYRFVQTTRNLPMSESRINTYSFKRVETRDYPNAEFDDSRAVGNPVAVTGEEKASSTKDWSFGLSPKLDQSFGGSEDFYMYAIGVMANASYQLSDHWLVSGSLYGDIQNNYDQFKYTVPPDGTTIKRVRTLNRKYYEDRLRIDSLQVNYFDKLSTNIYGQAYAGYLETMFAGVGTELLYRPYNKNWALGVDMNYVKQRDADTYLGVYKEETHYDDQTGRYYQVQTGVATGHATLYWQPKFWSLLDNTMFKISAGRFLAEDIGVNVDFSKQFDSGVIAGVFATKTDLSAAEFGEGSFNKGFYISIPLDLMTVKPSNSRATISWLPLQRDGGQMLGRKYSLYSMTDARSPWFTRPPQY